ncbi:YveK family protein [Levilactobacillus yonginensis]|uniref:YveK family protein n=1 Tax=Levilactobacillus yonginensis TaxID=1054041 RepID=UPI000F7882E4|nr:Wzz/FepE/Etk N-terminal domain-containing protein [Levilactobacillus yonginensis]
MESEQTINLAQVANILRKHVRLISLTTLLVTILAVVATFWLMTPKYQATTNILVNRRATATEQGGQLQQVQADVQMISTYKDIITSPTVLEPVSREIRDLPGHPKGLKQALQIENEPNSQVFSVTATATNPQTASVIANKTAQSFKDKIGKIMRIDNVSIVSPATASGGAVSPKKAINILLGVVAGLLMGMSLAFIREATDRTVTSEKFLTEDLGITSLGILSEIPQEQAQRRRTTESTVTGQTNTQAQRIQRRV